MTVYSEAFRKRMVEKLSGPRAMTASAYEGYEDVHPETRQRGHSLAYAFSQGTLQLSRQPDAREDVPATMPRARPVTEWLADPAFAWPRQPPSPQH